MTREKAFDLFQAYIENKIPREAGFILRGSETTGTDAHVYEITHYADIKDVCLGRDGITFRSNADRFFFTIDSTSLPVFVSREPIRLVDSFSIPHSEGADFTLLFPMEADVYVTLGRFLSLTWADECGLEHNEAAHLAEASLDTIKHFIGGET